MFENEQVRYYCIIDYLFNILKFITIVIKHHKLDLLFNFQKIYFIVTKSYNHSSGEIHIHNLPRGQCGVYIGWLLIEGLRPIAHL